MNSIDWLIHKEIVPTSVEVYPEPYGTSLLAPVSYLFNERDIILLFQCVYTLSSGKDELRLIKGNGNLSSVPCVKFAFHITWCNLDHRRLPAPFLRIWSISWDSLRKYKHWRGKALKCEQTRENKHILVQLWGLRKSTYYGSVLKASLASSPL